jgi:trimeric autotransporter adhesin
MSKRYVVLGLALAIALCFALPAVGASPGSLADALGLAKKAQKQAKKATKRATSASTQAQAAQSTANAAQSGASQAASAAGSAQASAGAAQSSANGAAAAATAARTSARQVYRNTGPDLVPAETEVVATMHNVAPGAYVIMAKTDVFATGNGSGIVQCRVNAGSDSDAANSLLGDGPAAPEKSVFEATLEANVVHEFAGGGTIDMDCTNNGAGITVSAIQSKIIAIKVGDITGNEAVTG